MAACCGFVTRRENIFFLKLFYIVYNSNGKKMFFNVDITNSLNENYK